ncbi:hypothetical protein [Burkholderia multivorans]|uniref:hypothetical protein n=1 Tax=Burkholderia multivorans TaxID=87883 RepID=UPI0023ECFC05|nr:hypothetical protein [Burkholderia multivorans]
MVGSIAESVRILSLYRHGVLLSGFSASHFFRKTGNPVSTGCSAAFALYAVGFAASPDRRARVRLLRATKFAARKHLLQVSLIVVGVTRRF